MLDPNGADALLDACRFEEAWQAARSAWLATPASGEAAIVGIFAAAALGDPERIEEAVEAHRDAHGGIDQAAVDAMGAALVAALGGAWEYARASLTAAESHLGDGGAEQLGRARFRLAIGHLAAARFPEADEALAEAERWFSEHGRAGHAAAYRAAAVRPVAGVRAPPA
jgi:hypothetical protein